MKRIACFSAGLALGAAGTAALAGGLVAGFTALAGIASNGAAVFLFCAAAWAGLGAIAIWLGGKSAATWAGVALGSLAAIVVAVAQSPGAVAAVAVLALIALGFVGFGSAKAGAR